MSRKKLISRLSEQLPPEARHERRKLKHLGFRQLHKLYVASRILSSALSVTAQDLVRQALANWRDFSRMLENWAASPEGNAWLKDHS